MTVTESMLAAAGPSVAAPKTLRRWSVALAIVWLAVAAWLLFTSDPGGRAQYSTLGHFLLFGAIAAANSAVALTFATDAVSEMRSIWIAAVVTGCIAVATEAIQQVLPVRQSEMADLAFDITGVAVATVGVLALLTVLGRSAVIEMLVGACVVGLALLGVALFVFATQPDESVVDAACPTPTGPASTDAAEFRLRLTPPTAPGGCVAADDGWMAPLLGAVTWSSRDEAVDFELGGLQSAAQPELAEAIRTSGEFTVAVRLRPEDLFENPITRWILEVAEPDRPGRPLMRVLQAGRQIRSDVTAGNEPGDLAILAAADGLSEDEWFEVVVIVDESQHQMFVNGEISGTLRRDGSELVVEDDIAIVLGLREITPAHQFLGQISDVIVLPRAIDPDEIADLFDNP